MAKKLMFTLALSLTLIGASLASPAFAPGAAAAAAPHRCECVEMVKNKFGLSGASGDAKNMGGYLINKGFRKVANPQVGAVVIFQPSFGTAINQRYGHVGVIASVQSAGSNWSITVEGANQGGASTKYTCNNVSTIPYKSYPKTSTSVAYYVR